MAQGPQHELLRSGVERLGEPAGSAQHVPVEPVGTPPVAGHDPRPEVEYLARQAWRGERATGDEAGVDAVGFEAPGHFEGEGRADTVPVDDDRPTDRLADLLVTSGSDGAER